MKLLIKALVHVVALAALAAAYFSSADCAEIPAADDSTQSRSSREPAEVGDAKRREAFELINRSTDLMGWDEPDPVALVRAVNYLRALGKAQAIETLLAYVRYAPVHGKFGKSHAPDQQRLCWIVPLLFVPTHEGADLPSLGRDAARNAKEWEAFHISLDGDLPFHNAYFGGRTGTPDPARGYLVEWAAKHARLRDEPLLPANDTLKAADNLCEKLHKDNKDRTSRYNEFLEMHIRMQARRSIEHLLPEELRNRRSPWLLDDEWNLLKEAAAKLKIHWNETEQKYTGG